MNKLQFGVCVFAERPLPEVVAQVRLAEELGYHSVWLADSQLLCRELYVTLTACALNTTRIKLGAGVTAPYTRHASVTASAFATLNEIAEGRLLLGVSTGNSLVRTIGVRPSKISELEEYVGRIRGLLENRPVEFEGRVRGKITWLDRPSGIPVYVAATGPRLTRAAVRMSDGVIILVGAAPSLMRKGFELVGEAAQEVGKRWGDLDVVCWVPASISRNGALAREHVSKHVGALLSRVPLESFDEEDRPEVERLRGSFSPYPHGGGESSLIVPDRIIDMLALAGSPEEVREQVEALKEVAGVNTIVLNTQVSRGTRYPPLESVLRDFAEGVMAHVA